MRQTILAFISALLLLAVPAWAADITVLAANGQPVGLITQQQIQGLPQHEFSTATPWGQAATYRGPRLTEVLQQAGLNSPSVILTAADDYKVTLSLADLQLYQPILAWRRDGQPLPLRDRGPYWLMFNFDSTPDLRNDVWYYRAIWQVVSITVSP